MFRWIITKDRINENKKEKGTESYSHPKAKNLKSNPGPSILSLFLAFQIKL